MNEACRALTSLRNRWLSLISPKQVRPKMISESHRSAFRYLRKHDHSGFFWLKAVGLLPLLEITGLLRVIAYRLRPRPRQPDRA